MRKHRNTQDNELRELERRAAAGEAVGLKLAIAHERADGAVSRFQDELQRTLMFARFELSGPEDDAPEVCLRESINAASHVVSQVLDHKGYYGTDGEFGVGPGIMEMFFADFERGIVEFITVFDDERLMLTVGARSTQYQDNYSAWPETRLFTVERSMLTHGEAARGWWTRVGADQRAPWLAWSRARHELAVVDANRPIYDRIRVPEEIARRWVLLTTPSDL